MYSFSTKGIRSERIHIKARTEEDLAAFEERTAKLIDFYDGITVFGNYENMRR